MPTSVEPVSEFYYAGKGNGGWGGGGRRELWFSDERTADEERETYRLVHFDSDVAPRGDGRHVCGRTDEDALRGGRGGEVGESEEGLHVCRRGR